MIGLIERLKNTEVQHGQLAVCSLGQAGYVIKNSSQKYVVIDPYLTDFCEHKIGLAFKRLMPIVMSPEQMANLPLTAYLMTHHHEDHLDVECIEEIEPERFPYYAPPFTIGLLNELGVSAARCRPLYDGASYEIDGFTIHGVYADHGESAPDAVGIIVQTEGLTVYHMGDTCLCEEEFRGIAARFSVDLLLAPINGKYGNMTETDAAAAVGILKPKYAAPCHFWMLPGNSGGDPMQFIEDMKNHSPSTEALLLTQGEIFKML